MHTLPTTPAESTYEIKRNKGQVNGYAGIGTDGYVPTAQLGSGSASVSTFLRGDKTWGAASGPAGPTGPTGPTGATGASVTGPTGPTGSAGSNSFISQETPTGTIGGTNNQFILANTPVTGTLAVYLNGQRLTYTGDYTLSGTTITMVSAPLTGDVLRVDYFLSGAATGNADTLDGQHAPTGDIVGTSDTQTLTNKTLTSPKLNENVAVTTTATEINNLHSKTVNLDGWTSFVPSWSGLTVGSGANSGNYCQIGKTVHFHTVWLYGAGAAVSGSITLTLPVTPQSIDAAMPIGNISIYDASSGVIYAGTISQTGLLNVNKTDGTYAVRTLLSSTVPITWATNDILFISGTYRAA